MNTPAKGRREALCQYGMLVLGSAILAFGLYNVHQQSNITEGGILGLVLFLEHWLGLTPAVASPVLDITCYLIGMRILGMGFAKCSVIASLSFAFWYAVLEQFPPLLPSLAAHPIAAAVIGALFVGFGVGLAVRAGGAAGGDDALAMTISHTTGWPISRAYLISDLVVLVLSITYIPVWNIFCSLITVTLSSFIIGKVHSWGREPEQDEKEKSPDGALAAAE